MEHTLAPLDRLVSCGEALLVQLRQEMGESATHSVHQQILQLEHHAETLRVLRATYANREMQLLLLLQLTNQLPVVSSLETPVTAPQPASETATDFYHRTRHLVPDAFCNESGYLSVFDDALVTRYLDCVIVANETCEVIFKAGVRVRLHVH